MRGIVGILLVVVVPPVLNAASWTRTTADGLEVLSNAGARATRTIADRLIAAESVFRDAPEAPQSMPPIRALVFGTERDYRPFRLGPDIEGFFQGAPDRLWLVVNAGAEDAPRVAMHEYVHALLSRSPVRLPAWLEEGLPELYSTLLPSGQGVAVGHPLPVRLATLATGKWLDAAELSGHAQNRASMFYAESWALTHMLSLSPRYRGRMQAFVAALSNATPPASAFREAFGISLDDAVKDLRAYVSAGIRPVILAGVARQDPTAGQTSPATAAESLAIRAELLLLMRRDEQAAELYTELARKHPGTVEARTGLAILAMRRGDAASARELFRDAVQSGEAGSAVWFEYAMLLNDARASDAEVDAALAKVVDLSPNHAEAHMLLGIHAGRVGRWDEAERELHRAAALLPQESRVWYELAWALKSAGRIEPAREAARRALQLSTSTEDEAKARALLEGLD